MMPPERETIIAERAPRRCWLWSHEWSKWEMSDYEQTMFSMTGPITVKATHQLRRCFKKGE